MTLETKLDIDSVNVILNCLIGEYVWGIQCGADGILRMEFGEPYLRVEELPPGLPSSVASSSTGRRLVMPTGRWSLFVEDGDWAVDADGIQCSRFDAEKPEGTTCLSRLSGQRLEKARVSPDNLTLCLEFDRLGSLQVEAALDETDNDQWMLFTKGEGILSFGVEHGFVMEI